MLSASCRRTAFSNGADDQEHRGDECHEQQVREAHEHDDGERCRHAARTSSTSANSSTASLRSVAVPLAAGLVDTLEERAARVVEREEVDESDVLQHLGGSVSREAILVRRARREATARHRRRSRGERPSQPFAPTSARLRGDARSSARRPLRRRVPPHARHGRERTTRRRRGARRARRRRPCPLRVPSVSTAAARTFGSESHVSSISVASPSVGIRTKQRRAPEADCSGSSRGARAASSAPGAGASSLELGRDARALSRARAAATSRSRSIAHSSPMSPSVRIAAAAIIGSGSSSSGRISRGTAGWCARSRRCSAVTRRHRPHSVRGRRPARGGRGARRRDHSAVSSSLAAPAVVPKPSENDRERQRDPRRERDREHDKSDAENERVHPLVVVAWRRVPSLDRGIRASAALSPQFRAIVSFSRSPGPALRRPSAVTVRPAAKRPQGLRGGPGSAQRIRPRPERSWMRMRGLEPPRPYGHTDLNRARLPIPPHPRGRTILASGRLTPR